MIASCNDPSRRDLSNHNMTHANAPSATSDHFAPKYDHAAGFGHVRARESRRASQDMSGRKSSIFLAVLAVILFGAVPALSQTGTLAPVPQQVFLDNSGNPLASGKVYTYLAGTSTPATTYTDSGLGVAHPNPIILNSAGRPAGGAIYLSQSVNYKFVVKTSADVTLYTQDNIASTLSSSVASSDNGTCDGRLTLTSATPVTTSDVTAATTVYWTPFRGSRCALYDGTTWTITNYTELSIALGSDAADTNYDVFFYSNSGTPAVERVAWTNATTRATALTTVNGVLVKSSDTTKRYVGTYRTTGSVGQTEDSFAKRFVWNYYNRVRRGLRVTDSTDSWTYTTAAFRQANNAATNQVAVVVGVAEALVSLHANHSAQNSAGITLISTGIGEDSATVAATGSLMEFTGAPATTNVNMSATVHRYPAVGYHYYAWLEYSAASGTTTWYGDAGTATVVQNGLSGFIEG